MVEEILKIEGMILEEDEYYEGQESVILDLREDDVYFSEIEDDLKVYQEDDFYDNDLDDGLEDDLDNKFLDFYSDNDDLKLTKEERETYTEENLGLVKFVAKKFSNTGIEEDELVSVALEGYTKALNKYRKNKKTKFTTYAHKCMFNEILAYLRKEKKWGENVTSLNAPISSDKNGNVLDLEKIIKDDGEKQLDEVVIDKDISVLIVEALDVLNDMERYITMHRFGICGKEEKTQKAIAAELDISQAYVSKLEKDCLTKMKKYIQEEDLKNGVLGKNEYFNYY